MILSPLSSPSCPLLFSLFFSPLCCFFPFVRWFVPVLRFGAKNDSFMIRGPPPRSYTEAENNKGKETMAKVYFGHRQRAATVIAWKRVRHLAHENCLDYTGHRGSPKKIYAKTFLRSSSTAYRPLSWLQIFRRLGTGFQLPKPRFFLL